MVYRVQTWPRYLQPMIYCVETWPRIYNPTMRFQKGGGFIAVRQIIIYLMIKTLSELIKLTNKVTKYHAAWFQNLIIRYIADNHTDWLMS